MMHGRDSDTKDMERRGIPVRTSGRTACCFVLRWPPKRPNVASCREGLSRKAQKGTTLSSTGEQAAQIPHLRDCPQEK